MPLSDDDLAGFDNVVALPRAAAGSLAKPEPAGQAVQLAQTTGFPSSVVGADLESFQQIDKGQRAAEAIERNQWISGYVARNPEAAEVSNDDYDRLDEVSKRVKRFSITGREGGLINAIPEFFLQSVPETYSMLASAEGRAKFAKNFPKVLQHIVDPLLAPGDFSKHGFDIHDPVDLDRAMGLGLLVGLGKTAPKVGLPNALKGEVGPNVLSSGAEIDRFLIDAILTKGQDPKKVLQIEHAKADSAALDRAVVAVSETATRERAPTLIEDFIKGHETGTLTIPAEAIADLYRAEGKVPVRGDGLFGFVPDLPRTLAGAIQTGVEIDVPVATYLAHIDPTVHEKVKENIRFSNDGLTLAEAKETDPKLSKVEEGGEPVEKTPFEIEREELGVKPLFAEPLPGMTKTDFERYNKKVAAAQQKALDKATEVQTREAAKRRGEEWKANEAALRPEVEAQVRAFPDIAADRFLRDGTLPDGSTMPKVRLDEGYVNALLDKTEIPAVMLGKNGVHPDDIAPLFGFNSGAEMVRSLNDLAAERRASKQSPTQHLNDLVARELVAQMEAKHGNLEAAIADEARALALDELHFDILADEMRMLAAEAGGAPPFTKDSLKATAEQLFSRLDAKTAANFEKFQKTAGRNGLLAERAWMKGAGDPIEAFNAKQKQAFNFLTAKEAQKFRKEVDRAEKLYSNYAKNANIKAVEQSFTDQIHRLLTQYGFDVRRDVGNITQSLAGKSLENFIAERKAAGDLIMDPELPVVHDMTKFTVDEVREFNDLIKNLDHLGRDAKKIIVNGKKEDYVQSIAEIRNNLDALTKRSFDPLQTRMTGRIAREVDSRLIKIEQLVDWIDKNDSLGSMNGSVYRGMVEGEAKKHDMITKLAKEVTELGTTREWSKGLADKIDNKILKLENGQFAPLTNENKIVIALNFGNASNIDILTRGHGWDKTDIQTFLNQHMTKEDIKFVKGIWTLWDNLAPLVEAETTRRSGVSIKMIEREPLTIAGENLPGGYYPLIKDPVAQILGKQTKGDLFDTAYFNPLPMARALKRRTGVAYPLNLTINAMAHRINETVHAVFMSEPVANANKVLSDPLVREGIANAFGIEYVKQLRPWLEDIANNGGAFDDSLGVWLSRNARENVVSMLMGFKVSTAVIHGGSALATSIYEVGAAPFIKAVKELGLGQFIPRSAKRFFNSNSQMLEEINWVFENSPEIRNRQRSMTKDFNYQLQNIVNQTVMDDLASIRTAYLTWSMALVGYGDQLSASVVWRAAYDKAVKADNLSHEDAVFVADKVVRQAHGSASLVNRANIGRGELNRWLTFAYNGYWNHNYNRTRDAYRETTGDGANFNERLIIGSAALTALIIIPGLVHYAVRGTDTKTWGGMAAETLASQFGGQIPGVNAMTSAFIHNRDPSLSPMDEIVKGVTAIIRDAKKIHEGKQANQWVKHVIETPGWMFGLGPTRQLSTGMQFLVDVQKRKENPKSVMEYARGLITGHAQKKRH